ncbi:hypothetical protein [Liquorilactobacillus sicerae]|uniref:hypothetical protein n=1 Tax=Liquorilactobacillus sicerae TaxID=1416943 RepID=UPI00248187BD|nr:hypothetical protein [Liquorilactobacillus sicerae]
MLVFFPELFQKTSTVDSSGSNLATWQQVIEAGLIYLPLFLLAIFIGRIEL